jgi:hypothetical protein
MRDYLNKLSTYTKTLKKCSKWIDTNKTVGKLDLNSVRGKDYIYELFCYLTILNDLSNNYILEYYPGFGKNQNCFPYAPSKKEGRPFFYLLNKNKDKFLQVCAGTKIKSIIDNNRAPDISFQNPNADLNLPQYNEILMIFDAKRKRENSNSEKVLESQYSSFAVMIKELGTEEAHLKKIEFKEFVKFNGNCLITNKKACRGIKKANELHKLKEIEFFDEKVDIKKINIIG